jgi:hypothetical protein
VVLQAIEQGIDQGLVAEELIPLLEVEVGGDQGGLAA